MKKIKALLYCTKGKPYLINEYDNHYGLWDKLAGGLCLDTLNGTIPCECEIDVEKIIFEGYGSCMGYKGTRTSAFELSKKSCIYSFQNIDNYLQGKNGYALHISNLKVFDKPRELSEYYHYDDVRLTKAPQNMMSVYSITEHDDYVENNYCGSYEEFEEYVLISIQPQWLCKILNGEKDIEIRKQVLNCMKEEIK